MRLFWSSALSIFVLLGCAAPTPPSLQAPGADLTRTEWQGRLSLQVMSTPPTSLSARFMLRGDASHGTLDLYSPFGTTVGTLQWSPQQVQLNDGKQSQSFNSLADLTEKITGAALPMAAIFNWLEGRDEPVAGWRTDFSNVQEGSLVAQRTAPMPEVTLRIKLD